MIRAASGDRFDRPPSTSQVCARRAGLEMGCAAWPSCHLPSASGRWLPRRVKRAHPCQVTESAHLLRGVVEEVVEEVRGALGLVLLLLAHLGPQHVRVAAPTHATTARGHSSARVRTARRAPAFACPPVLPSRVWVMRQWRCAALTLRRAQICRRRSPDEPKAAAVAPALAAAHDGEVEL